MSELRQDSTSGGLSLSRLIGARVLTVLAILLALVGMIAYYVAHAALDETGFETISRNMIDDDAIRTQVANTAVDGLYTNVDVQGHLAGAIAIELACLLAIWRWAGQVSNLRPWD